MNRSPFSRAKSDRLCPAQHGLSGRNLRQAIRQFTGALHRESRTDFPRILKHAILLIAEIERAQSALAFSGITESDDNEFLAQRAFDFEPTLAAAGDIWGIGLLRNNALQPGFASLCKHLFALAR